MRGRRKAVQIPTETYAAIEAIAQAGGRDVASVLDEMLDEALRMRRVRGIVFADEFQRREAKVGGTGLGVWEVVETYQIMGEDWDRFRAYYDWLNESQLCAALEYWKAYPEEVDEKIKRNQSWTQETIWEKYPETKPPSAVALNRAPATPDA